MSEHVEPPPPRLLDGQGFSTGCFLLLPTTSALAFKKEGATPVIMSSLSVSSGSYTNTYLRKVYHGPGCTAEALPEALSLLASSTRRAYIITGKSLATKTNVVKTVEQILGDAHVGTSSNIGQHAPVEDIRAALKEVREKKADVLVGE